MDAALESRVVGDQPDYRLGMYRGDGDEQARNGPGVGWGMIAYKLSARTRVQHVPFRVSHKGFYVRFPGEDKSVLVRNLLALFCSGDIDAMCGGDGRTAPKARADVLTGRWRAGAVGAKAGGHVQAHAAERECAQA